MIVIKRAIQEYPEDINLIMAAVFNDLGKLDVLGVHPKTGNPTAFGHEQVSVEILRQFKTWVRAVGADITEVEQIVAHHMRIKSYGEMSPKKQKGLEDNPFFSQIKKFNTLDTGGYYYEK